MHLHGDLFTLLVSFQHILTHKLLHWVFVLFFFFHHTLWITESFPGVEQKKLYTLAWMRSNLISVPLPCLDWKLATCCHCSSFSPFVWSPLAHKPVSNLLGVLWLILTTYVAEFTLYILCVEHWNQADVCPHSNKSSHATSRVVSCPADSWS